MGLSDAVKPLASVHRTDSLSPLCCLMQNHYIRVATNLQLGCKIRPPPCDQTLPSSACRPQKCQTVIYQKDMPLFFLHNPFVDILQAANCFLCNNILLCIHHKHYILKDIPCREAYMLLLVSFQSTSSIFFQIVNPSDYASIYLYNIKIQQSIKWFEMTYNHLLSSDCQKVTSTVCCQ